MADKTTPVEELIRVARGERPADKLLRGGKLVNVLSGEIYDSNIALYGEFVVGIDEDYKAKEEIDLKGAYVCPGFIDGHVHIESSMVTVPQFARGVVPHGTTSVVTDPHEIANVLGYDGIRFQLESSKYNPLNVFFMLPSCVPASPLETSGSTLRAFDIYPFLSEKWVVGLAEVMNFPGVLNRDRDLLDKIKIASHKRIDGHSPGLSGRDLCAYLTTGIASDHECTTVAEAVEKLRKGMYLVIREGSAAKNLKTLLGAVHPENARRCFFCTDDRHPTDIVEEGHLDHIIRTTIASGVDPVTAIRMGTINPAEYFRLPRCGAVAPGYYADLVVVDDLHEMNVRQVYKNGQLVAEAGEMVVDPPAHPMETTVRSSVNIRWLEGGEFRIPVPEGAGDGPLRARVIEVVPGQIVTREIIEQVKVVDGEVVSDPERDILRMCVVERHKATGNVGKGLVRGFGLRKGALACTIAHDHHNIIVVGVDDDDLMAAVVQLNKMGGGIAVAADGKVVEKLELPIAGLMTDKPIKYVAHRIHDLTAAAKELGCVLHDPFMALSFLALPVIPALKLTDLGLVDVGKFDFVELFV